MPRKQGDYHRISPMQGEALRALYQLCTEKGDIIDNKEGRNPRDRDHAWKLITDDFNALNLTITRTTDQLKKAWANYTRRMKAKSIQYCQAVLSAGAGLEVDSPQQIAEWDAERKHPHRLQEYTEMTGLARKRKTPTPEPSSSAMIKQPKMISLYKQRYGEHSKEGGGTLHDISAITAPAFKPPQEISAFLTSPATPSEDSAQGGGSHDGSIEPTPAPFQPPSKLPTSSTEPPALFEVRHTADHFGTILASLAKDELFADVTLTAEGRSVKAHKSVLSAVSPYFREVLRSNPCQHPVIIMPYNVLIEDLKCIISFVYKGELTVSADRLESILQTGEVLKIEGLCSLDTLEIHTAADGSGGLHAAQMFHRDPSRMKPRTGDERSSVHDASDVSNVVGTFIDVENPKESLSPAIRVKQFAFSATDGSTSSIQNSASQASKTPPQQEGKTLGIEPPAAECAESPAGDETGDPRYFSKTRDVENSSPSSITERTNHRPDQSLEGTSSQLSRGTSSSDIMESEGDENPLHVENVDMDIVKVEVDDFFEVVDLKPKATDTSLQDEPQNPEN